VLWQLKLIQFTCYPALRNVMKNYSIMPIYIEFTGLSPMPFLIMNIYVTYWVELIITTIPNYGNLYNLLTLSTLRLLSVQSTHAGSSRATSKRFKLNCFSNCWKVSNYIPQTHYACSLHVKVCNLLFMMQIKWCTRKVFAQR